jgi:hypothetical protein
MIKESLIKSELLSLIGWRQNEDSNGVQIGAELLNSDSGMYYNDYHPLLTVDKLVSLCPDLMILGSNATERNEAFTKWLKEKTEGGIVKALYDWVNEKLVKQSARSVLGRSQLWAVSAGVKELDINRGEWAGIELVPIRSRELLVCLEDIGIQLSENQNVTLRLFNSYTAEEVENVVVNYQGNGGMQWEKVRWELSGEGSYYVVYDQSEISGMSVNGMGDRFQLTMQGKVLPAPDMLLASPFVVEREDGNLWDLTKMEYQYSSNMGINMRYSVRCDYTGFILDNREVFTELIGLHVASILLNQYLHNADGRLNRGEAMIDRELLMFELHGNEGDKDKGGLINERIKARNGIRLDNSSLDKVCLPCKKPRIEYGVI